MAKVYATPGVYIEEKSAFPNSAVPIATAVPAFIGYTEKAKRDKEDLKLKPTRLSSFADFLGFFGGAPKTTFRIENIRATEPANIYALSPQNGRYFLFHSMKLFFANGGSDCYVVSVGDYDDPITKDKLIAGLEPLLKEPEPTMVVIPDAVLLSKSDCFAVQQEMLKHCGQEMRSRVSIFDIPKGFQAQDEDGSLIEQFRNGIGANFLQWGAAYYPWVHSTIVGVDEVDFTNIEPKKSLPVLVEILKEQANIDAKDGLIKPAKLADVKEQIDTLLSVTADKATTKDGADDQPSLHKALSAISPLYKTIMKDLREQLNLLPPSGGIAGIYSMVDNTIGVWQSPANVTFGSVTRPAIPLTDQEQENLNVPLSGKAVNAIRSFPGKGTLIWGARTLDGNSQDWRYVSVRRTVIFIEQSIKYAVEAYVFEPNTAATWTNLKALITNFLNNVWQQGGLAGATPEDAFSVDVGLGITMTPVDILDGIMRISVKIAVTRPAEFIVITFQQKMQQS